MAQQLINIGQAPNDKSGDLIRTAFNKVNENFTELYAATGADIQIPSQTGNNGKFLTTSGSVLSWADVANGTRIENGLTNVAIPVASGDAVITINDGDAQYKFTGIGGLQAPEFQLPNNGIIRQNYTFTRTTISNIPSTSLGVVWTSLVSYISSAKLIIQLEATEVGDTTGWHSQVCEAVIASRGYANGTNGYGDPVMTVYGVTYTSTQPLVTFSVRRNIENKIEVVGTTTAATTDSPALRIHSVEISTRD